MPDKLVVFGSGGHAKVVVEAALERRPNRTIIVLDDADPADRPAIFGIRIFGGRDQLESLRGTPVIPAIGDNRARAQLLAWLREAGHTLETVVHPCAVVARSVTIDGGSFVSAGAVIVAEARVGAGAIINTGASVDHDCVIGSAAHVAPGAHLCGNVRIGDRTLIGAGTSIGPNVFVSGDVVLGAGSVVVRNIMEAGTFAGNPVRLLR